MATTEILVTRAATGSVGQTVALTSTDFGFDTSTPTPTGTKRTKTYTYTDSGKVGGAGTFPVNYQYEVKDSIVSASITGTMTKAAYNVGDNIDLAGIQFYEKYGSTPAGQPGTEITYPNSKIKVEDITDGSPVTFTTNLPVAKFNSTTNIATRQVKITFTPDAAQPSMTQTKTVSVTVYNQVKTVVPHGTWKTAYDLNETMATTEVLVTRTATGSVGVPVALSSTDFGFDSSTPGSKTKSYTYTDAGKVGGAGTFPVSYTYSVNDARTAVTIDGTVSAANSDYNWGETVNLSDLKIYEKFASDTSGGPGSPVPLTDARVKIEDITSGTVDIKADMSKPTSLAENLFNATTHKTTRTLKITFTADPAGGTGSNNVATKTVTINVLNNLDHIEISSDPGEAPTKSFSVNDSVTTPGGKIKIYRAANKTTSTEKANITMAMLNGTIDTSTQGTNKTATVTYAENDIRGTSISKTATYKYDVGDTSKGATFEGTFTKNKYNHGEALDFSEIKLYEKFASTPAGDKGVEINLNDASKVKIQDITTDTSAAAPNATTALATSYFDPTHWATRKIRISYVAGNGTTYTKEVQIQVLDTVDHIGISDDPKKTYAINESTANPGGKFKVFRKSSPTASTEEKNITEALLNGTVTTNTAKSGATATVTYEEDDAHNTKKQYPATFTYTVADVVTRIEIPTPQPKVTIKYGETLKDSDLAGIKIDVYKGGATKDSSVQVTAAMVSGLNNTKLGNQTVTVTYGKDLNGNDVTTQMEIEVVDYVKDITFVEPTKKTYEVGDTLDLAGGTLQKVMASGATTTIENIQTEVDAGRATLGTYDLSTTGNKSISVTWEGFTKSYGVTVSDSIQSISVDIAPNPTQTYGDALDLKATDGITNSRIAVVRSSGTTYETITPSMVSGYNPNQLGPQTVTVTHGGKTTTFTVNVEDKITGIEVTPPTKTTYDYGETLDLTGGTVKYIYAGGTVDTNPKALTDPTVTVTGGSTTIVGSVPVEVTYGGYKKQFNITVKDDAKTITITPPTDTNPLYGNNINLTGGEIAVTRSTGTENIPMTSPRVTIANYSSTTLTPQVVDVMLDGEKVGVITVTVQDYVKGLEITPPTKTTYEWGEELDLTGGSVAIKMASGAVQSQDDLALYMITNAYDKEQEGTQKLDVTYNGYTGSFDVKVVDLIKSIRILTPPDKTEYEWGEDIDPTGATIEVVKSSGITTQKVTRDMIKDYDAQKEGIQKVTVQLGDAKDTFTVEVGPPPVDLKPEVPPPPVIPPLPPAPTVPKAPTKPRVPTPVVTPEEPPKQEEPPKVELPKVDPPKQEEKPTEVLGVKDEDNSDMKLKAGITSLLGLSILLFLVASKRNVKVYVEEDEEFEFGGKDRITKNNRTLDIDKFLDGDTYQNRVLVHLNDRISEKLDGKEIEIKHRGEYKKFKVEYNDEPFEIVLE